MPVTSPFDRGDPAGAATFAQPECDLSGKGGFLGGERLKPGLPAQVRENAPGSARRAQDQVTASLSYPIRRVCDS